MAGRGAPAAWLFAFKKSLKKASSRSGPESARPTKRVRAAAAGASRARPAVIASYMAV